MKKMKHDKPKGQWKKLVKKTAALIAAAVVLASTEGVAGVWTRNTMEGFTLAAVLIKEILTSILVSIL